MILTSVFNKLQYTKCFLTKVFNGWQILIIFWSAVAVRGHEANIILTVVQSNIVKGLCSNIVLAVSFIRTTVVQPNIAIEGYFVQLQYLSLEHVCKTTLSEHCGWEGCKTHVAADVAQEHWTFQFLSSVWSDENTLYRLPLQCAL